MIRKALARLPGALSQQKTVAVDLTPWPTAVNGVDGMSVHHWLRTLAGVQSQWRWILLTAPDNHDAFAALESVNVRRHCVAPALPEIRLQLALQARPANRLHRAWKKVLRRMGLPRPPVLCSPSSVAWQS